MKKTLTLKNPILINGVETSELSYDANAITPPLFAQAEAMKKEDAGLKNVAIVPAVEFDFSLHMYLGFAAIMAVNPQISFSDMQRIHGRDIVSIMQIGRNFILLSEESAESNSDDVSEITAELSTPQQVTLKKSE